MNTVISATGNMTIVGNLATCSGSYSNSRWLINADWQATGGNAISINTLIAQITSGFDFDPNHLLPSISFTAIHVGFNPGTSSSFACSGSINWPKPFGIPIGLGVNNLVFLLLKQNNAPLQIQVSGDAYINSTSVHAAIYFTGGTPDFILVDAMPTLSLSGILHQFFGSGANIPGNFIDLTLTNNHIYYLAANGTVPTGIPITAPQQGLNLASTCTLELAGQTLPAVDVTVNVASGNGIAVTGTFQNPVSLAGFLSLTGVGYTGGPSLNISTQNGNTTFGMSCGLQFLGYNFGTGVMTIDNSTGQKVLTAQLTYNGTLGPFTNPKLNMKYSDGHFAITNWPGVQAANLAIDFAKALNNINNAKGCGKILNLVLDNTVETNFTISPNFTTQKPNIPGVADGQFYLVLSGFYTISATGTVVCSLDMPQLALSFSAPSDFSFNSIMTQIGDTIVSNAESVVQQLVNDPKALALFITVFAGKKVASQIVDQICDKALSAALETFVGALGTVGEGVLAALGAAGGALVSLGCGSSSGGGGGGGGGGGSSPNIQPLATPQILSAVITANNWTVTWGAVSGTNYYQVIITDGNNKCINVQYVANTAATIALPAALNAAPYTCQVVAWANPGMNYNSAPGTATLSRLGQPTSVTLQVNYTTGMLTCVFAPVANATGYTTAVYNGSTQLKVTTAFTVESDGNIQVNFPVMALLPVPHQYIMGITATGGNTYLPGLEWMSQPQPLNWGVGFTTIGSTFNVS
jgi:hypothetical protein